MRRAILTIASAFLLTFSLAANAQQPAQGGAAEAARKAREQKKQPAKPGKVFTNDNIPGKAGGVSVVGTTPAPPKEGGEKEEGKKDEKGEAYWRGRFADARTALRQAEKELDLLQREFNLLERQYYSDPNQALREQLERRDINEQRRKIEDKKKEIEQHKQNIANLEDELRRSGGQPAWAREP